jgi:hypothetical protein
VGDFHSGLRDELIDPSVEIAPAANHVLNGVQPVLPGSDLLVIAPAMF